MNKDMDLKLLEDILAKYSSLKGSLITILQQTQEAYGYISKEAIYLIAEKTGKSPAQVMGVATFYSQFRLEPIGKYLIMLCQGTACHVNSSKTIEEAISAYLQIKDGETTDDGLFSLKNVACLGCCSLSPVMMINGETFGNLTPMKAIEIIKNLQQEEMK